MVSEKIFIVEPNTLEESRALEAFVRALKIKFQISEKEDINVEILKDLHSAVDEMNSVKKGKAKARNVKELIDEL